MDLLSACRTHSGAGRDRVTPDLVPVVNATCGAPTDGRRVGAWSTGYAHLELPRADRTSTRFVANGMIDIHFRDSVREIVKAAKKVERLTSMDRIAI